MAIAEDPGEKPIKNYNNNEYASERSTSEGCLMRTITNDYRDAQILNLGSAGQSGPYLVTQTGVAPSDPIPKT